MIRDRGSKGGGGTARSTTCGAWASLKIALSDRSYEKSIAIRHSTDNIKIPILHALFLLHFSH